MLTFTNALQQNILQQHNIKIQVCEVNHLNGYGSFFCCCLGGGGATATEPFKAVVYPSCCMEEYANRKFRMYCQEDNFPQAGLT